MARPYEIVFVGSEMVPFCKTGGLADVLGSLPVELAKHGLKVTAVIPYYRQVVEWAENNNSVPPIVVDRLDFFLPGYTGAACVRELQRNGIRVLFIDYPLAYDREQLYTEAGEDYPDNIVRFAVLSKAALEACKKLGIRPVIVHAHDWQASMAVVYLKTHYAKDPFFENTRTVLTIHNLGYQGRFPGDQYPALDLPWDYFVPEGLEYFHQVNLLKGGIVFADWVTTVSPTYAKEIQTPEFGAGLDGVLASRAYKLSGILNGVDYSEWDPRNDSFIPANYSPEDLSGKLECKRALQKEMGLEEGTAPLIGLVGRLASQKGIDIVAESIPSLVKEGCQLAILGTGEPALENLLAQSAGSFPGRVALKIGFSNPLAHLIEAGSDLFLMPSKYEPCGLNQMYSLRYGTVPVVTATGGLIDTIRNATPARLAKGTATGFVIKEHSAKALIRTVKKAVKLYRSDPVKWRSLVVTGMRKDFSWHNQSRKYIALYKKLLKTKAAEAILP